MKSDKKFDLIFIDAAKAQYIKFFEKYKVNLAPDGVIISDNLSFHGMVEDFSLTKSKDTIRMLKKIRKYIDFLKENQEFETEFFKVGDGTTAFENLPWVQAKAADVYEWAKAANKPTYSASEISGLDAYISGKV